MLIQLTAWWFRLMDLYYDLEQIPIDFTHNLRV
jgi:hypothetical protein